MNSKRVICLRTGPFRGRPLSLSLSLSMYTYISLSIYIYIYLHTLYIHIHIYIYIYIHILYTYIYIYIYTYIYIYIYIERERDLIHMHMIVIIAILLIMKTQQIVIVQTTHSTLLHNMMTYNLIQWHIMKSERGGAAANSGHYKPAQTRRRWASQWGIWHGKHKHKIKSYTGLSRTACSVTSSPLWRCARVTRSSERDIYIHIHIHMFVYIIIYIYIYISIQALMKDKRAFGRGQLGSALKGSLQTS